MSGKQKVQVKKKTQKQKQKKKQKLLIRNRALLLRGHLKKLSYHQRVQLAFRRRLLKFKISSFRLKQLLLNINSSCGRSSGRISVRHKCSRSFSKRLIFNLPYNILRYKLLSYGFSSNSSKLGIVLSSYNTLHQIIAPFISTIGQNIYCITRPKPLNIKAVRKQLGNTYLLKYIATGSKVSNITSKPQGVPVYVRSPGCYGTVLMKKRFRYKSYAGILLPSNKLVYVDLYCSAMLGRLSVVRGNYKTAGFMRSRGSRPRVRGVVMNPVDHPHGGGEGKKSNPSTPRHPWGTQNKWKKTLSKDFIVKRDNFIYKMKRFTINLL